MSYAGTVEGAQRLGLRRQDALVSLGVYGIELTDVEGSAGSIPFDTIKQARVGFSAGRNNTFFFTRLWLKDGQTVLFRAGDDRDAYARFAYELAGALLAEGVRVETGDTAATVIFTFVFWIAIIGALSWRAWQAVEKGSSIVLHAVLITVFGAILLVLGPWMLTRWWPRRVMWQADVLRALPGLNATQAGEAIVQ
jgi:hypothetical protein